MRRWLLETAGIRAVLNRFPVLFPGFSPSHFPAASYAKLAWQKRFIPFKPLFFRPRHTHQLKKRIDSSSYKTLEITFESFLR